MGSFFFIEQQMNQLKDVLGVLLLLHNYSDVEGLSNRLLKETMQLTEAENGILWRLKNEGLRPLVTRGPKAKELKVLRGMKGDGLVGKVVTDLRPILITDLTQFPKWANQFRALPDYAVNTILCVPLIYRGRCLGAIQLINKIHHDVYEDRDLKAANLLSTHGAGFLATRLDWKEQEGRMMNLLEQVVTLLDRRNGYDDHHSKGVRDLALVLADRLGMPPRKRDELALMALLHDLGTLGVPDELFHVSGRLTSDEKREMETHAPVAADTLAGTALAEGIRHHHERYDGMGYPDGLQGSRIPVMARILAIAEAYQAMGEERAYREPLSGSERRDALREGAGNQFDPKLVELFLAEKKRM